MSDVDTLESDVDTFVSDVDTFVSDVDICVPDVDIRACQMSECGSETGSEPTSNRMGMSGVDRAVIM